MSIKSRNKKMSQDNGKVSKIMKKRKMKMSKMNE